MLLQTALKEWAIATEALANGDTITLLRKGGIREIGGRFQVQQSQVWLYPTYEHQNPALLKAAYADRVQTVASGWHPETVALQAWANITHVLAVYEPQRVMALDPWHIWNERFINERLKWKAQSPLFVLLLRSYRLPQALVIPWEPAYGGCRSWLELRQAYPVETTQPVLSDTQYHQQVEAIQACLS
jgi:hypothetical protein